MSDQFIIEAQRELAVLATGYRPPFDPEKILEERFQAISNEVVHRPTPKPGWSINGDHYVFNGTTVHFAELAPDETAYIMLIPSSGELSLGIPRGVPHD